MRYSVVSILIRPQQVGLGRGHLRSKRGRAHRNQRRLSADLSDRVVCQLTLFFPAVSALNILECKSEFGWCRAAEVTPLRSRECELCVHTASLYTTIIPTVCVYTLALPDGVHLIQVILSACVCVLVDLIGFEIASRARGRVAGCLYHSIRLMCALADGGPIVIVDITI